MSGSPRRENARYILGYEFNNITEYEEGEGEMSPNYAFLPTGERANRAFIAGTVSDVEERDNGIVIATLVDMSSHSDDAEYSEVRVVAGQYQATQREKLRNLETPEFVAVSGKVNVYETDSGNKGSNIKPETVATISKEERDRWTLDAINKTLDRVEAFRDGEADAQEEVAESYGTDVSDYVSVARDALLETLPADLGAELDVSGLDFDVSGDSEAESSDAEDESDAAEGSVDADDAGDAPEQIGREQA